MPWYQNREPWTVQLGPYTLTPEQPGPAAVGGSWSTSGAYWQLSGSWALTYGPLGECRYGELGLTADPGLQLDRYEVLIWETADTNRPPDFRGYAGIVRGNRDLTRGAYTLALVGEGDWDATGLARYTSYTRINAGYGLTPEPNETTEAFHARILEPYGDGGWGVKGDGSKVVGTPSGGVALETSEVHGYTSSGYQRREYVTETGCSPGDRWKWLYDSRPTPLPYSPRVFAEAKTDNLLLLDVEQTPTYRAELSEMQPSASVYSLLAASDNQPLSRELIGDGKTVLSNDPPEAAERPVYRAKARVVIPLSGVVQASASSKYAVNAVYSAKSLTVRLKVSARSGPYLIKPLNMTNDPYIWADTRSTTLYGVLNFICYLVANATDQLDQALSKEFTGVYPLQAGKYGMSEEAIVPIPVPEDLVGEVYKTINNGHYFVVIEGELVTQSAYRFDRLPDSYTPPEPTEGGSPQPAPPKHRRQYSDVTASIAVLAPIMVVDALRTSIPPENYPPGWDAPSISPPTHQGRVPGCLIPPGTVGGLYITEARTVREYGAQYTELQTGARQTQKLLKSEKNLRTAVTNETNAGGAW